VWEAERLILRELRLNRYLLCFDGLERLLNGYKKSPEGKRSVRGSFREFYDRRFEIFFLSLSAEFKSKFICTTREIPSVFSNSISNGDVLYPPLKLDGLDKAAAEVLWSAIFSRLLSATEIRSPRNLNIFLRRCQNHPLTIYTVACAVASSPLLHYSLDEWVRHHGISDLAQIPIKSFRTSLIDYAISCITDHQTLLCGIISCFTQDILLQDLEEIASHYLTGGDLVSKRSRRDYSLDISNLQARGLERIRLNPAHILRRRRSLRILVV
jgi:hypothetical protein